MSQRRILLLFVSVVFPEVHAPKDNEDILATYYRHRYNSYCHFLRNTTTCKLLYAILKHGLEFRIAHIKALHAQ